MAMTSLIMRSSFYDAAGKNQCCGNIRKDWNYEETKPGMR